MSLSRIGTTLLAIAALTVGTLLLLPASALRAQTEQASPSYSVTVVNHSGVAMAGRMAPAIAFVKRALA